MNSAHVCALVGVALVLCTGSGIAEDGVSKSASPVMIREAFFADPTVRLFDLSVSQESLLALAESPQTYVPGEMKEGETVLARVGVRMKGSRGSFRVLEQKPAFAIKFDQYIEEQSYRGFKKLLFNNSVQDSSYVSELLATGLFRDAGLPAARVTHARMRLNGRDLGLYVVVEAMNKDFLKYNFGSGKGNLYETSFQDIIGPADQDNGEDESQADLRGLQEVCRIPDPTARWAQLNKVLDVDRFISFVAMEMLIAHWDGYAAASNNNRIYHDPKTDKMVFIPHGLDGPFRRPNFSIQAPLRSVVVTAVLTTPEGQRLYEDRIRKLAKDVFKVPVILERMEGALAKIRTAGMEPAELAKIERAIADARERITLRGIRVNEQLNGVKPEGMKTDAAGFAYPVSWREEYGGNAVLDRSKYKGKKALHIRVVEKSTRASWRSVGFLEPGIYRFEGLVSTHSLTGSACLRISGSRVSTGMTGDSPWQLVKHDFSVAGEGRDVEFVCELVGDQGDVWFDLDSLRVKRIAPVQMQREGIIRPPPILRLLLEQ
jgi:spore coat protein H